MKPIAAFALGIAIGWACFFGMQKAREFGQQLWPIIQIHESSTQARAKIEATGTSSTST
jgi:hypothetical protein